MILDLLLLVILIIINGLFSATEIAFLSVNKYELSKLAKQNNKKAVKIEKLLSDTSTLLSTIQIAITISGFLASAFAADTFTDQIISHLTINYLSVDIVRTIILVVTTLILSYFTLVFGELIPKKIGLAYPLKVSLMMVTPINIITKLCYPFIKILSFSTNIFVKLFKIKPKKNAYSEEDIKTEILQAEDSGVIAQLEKELILKVFDFSDTQVKDIMTPTKDVIFLNIDDDIKNNISIIKHSKYTRFPVYEGNINNIVGILNIKDLITQKKPINSLRPVLRKAYNLQYNNHIDDTFYIMKEEHIGMAIVRSNNEVVGITTMEDIIEEIVGNVYDEYD